MSAFGIRFVDLIYPIEWFFIVYFLLLNGIYILLNFIAVYYVHRHMEERRADPMENGHTGFEPPVTLIAPAFNEEKTIAGTVYSLLQLNYPEFEIVVVNDGSTDGTLQRLTREFDLEPFPEVYRIQIDTEPVHSIYRSRSHPNLRVVDKVNGGKADALNAGINTAHCPLICTIDADSILQRDSLLRIVQPFMEDSSTVAAGGTVRVANGCRVRDGFVEGVGLPNNPLALIQVIEYLRAFLFGRLGWSRLNSLLVISGAFGVYHRHTAAMVGGFRTDTVGEDMELVVRMHNYLGLIDRPYRIVHIPEPVCWTEVPENPRALMNQRVRWQRGLSESLTMNFGVPLRGRGFLRWLGFPFNVIFEWLGPIFEVAGYLFVIIGFLLGIISPWILIVFFMVSMGLGTLLSVMSLLIEEMSFRIYRRPVEILKLFAAALVENFGYRQMITLFRLLGLFRWVSGSARSWGEQTRTGEWQEMSA